MDENKSNLNDFKLDVPVSTNVSPGVSLDFGDTTEFNSTPKFVQKTETDKEHNPNAVRVKKYVIYLRKHGYGEK